MFRLSSIFASLYSIHALLSHLVDALFAPVSLLTQHTIFSSVHSDQTSLLSSLFALLTLCRMRPESSGVPLGLRWRPFGIVVGFLFGFCSPLRSPLRRGCVCWWLCVCMGVRACMCMHMVHLPACVCVYERSLLPRAPGDTSVAGVW